MLRRIASSTPSRATGCCAGLGERTRGGPPTAIARAVKGGPGVPAPVSGRAPAPVGVVFLTNVLPAGLRGGGEIVPQSIVEARARGGEDVRVFGSPSPGPTA